MGFKFTYKPDGEVLKAYLKDDSFFRLIRGPVGSGKSVASCVEIFRRALEMPKSGDGKRKSRWAVIRNTNPQLKTTTIKTWLEWFPEDVFGKFTWSVPYTHNISLGDVELEVIFLALDRPEDVKKLLSLELTGIFINEAREVPKSIIDACTMRVGRYPRLSDVDGGDYWTGCIADTNAPEEDHWWPILAGDVPVPDHIPASEAKLMVRPPDWRFFNQPPGMIETKDDEGTVVGYTPNKLAENAKHMRKDYYDKLLQGKSKSWIDVYVLNKLGTISDGKPVYPLFAPTVHIAKEGIPVAAGLPVYVGLDFGLTPAATLGQKVRERWLVQREIVAFDMGITRFAELLREVLSTQFAAASEVKIYGDPSGDFRAQTDETTPFQILRGAGLQAYPTHSNDPALRIEAVNSQLSKMVDGHAGFLIDRSHCPHLTKGFEGGYHYRRLQVSGERYEDKPSKNAYSHVHDALQYMMLGAGAGRALLRPQQQLTPSVANSDFDVYTRRAKSGRSGRGWNKFR